MAMFLRARAQIADNFENKSLICGNPQFISTIFPVFHFTP